jgi:DNA polymerase IV
VLPRADVANADHEFLFEELGRAGLHFHALAQAEDPRPVTGRRASKSVGSERTLDKDVSEKADIRLHLRQSADGIGRRLRQKSYGAFGVGVKVKTTDFQILTRQRRLSEPTDIAETLYSVGVDLLNEVDHPGPPSAWLAWSPANDLTKPPEARVAPTLDFLDDRPLG